MRILSPALLLFLTLAPPVPADLAWRELAPLPDAHGFAGAFAGVSHGCLLAAGGANFPEAPPWEGGKKAWSDAVFVLERPDGQWHKAGQLPGPRAYGVSVSADGGVLCIGGSDSERHHADCFLLKWENGKLATDAYPPLPVPLAEMTGALLGRTLHVVGGTRIPAATEAQNTHFMLDLDALEKGWRQETFPGPARILAVSAVQDSAFFVMSGATLAPDAENKPERTYLRDAWQYTPATGWREIPAMPRAALAAPSPAPLTGVHRFMIAGGDDGTHAGYQPASGHPGFSRSILIYHTLNRTWTESAAIPATLAAPVTTPTAVWQDLTVIPGGEIRPATRTPRVMALTVLPEPR